MVFKILVLFIFCRIAPSSADLVGFVYEKMQDFPTYIKDNNLDPTTPDTETQTFSDSNVVFSVETELSNLVIAGYSADISVDYIQGDLVDGRFSLDLVFHGPFTSSGTHVTNWTLLGKPIFSQGQWKAEQRYILIDSAGIRFSVLPSGYLNVTKVERPYAYWSPFDVTFEGITDNEAVAGYEEFVKPLLESVVTRSMGRALDVVVSIFEDFWIETLSNTTLVELIGHTGTWGPPEPTAETTPYWTDPPVESTPTTGSTPDPCRSNPNIVEEKVLESKIVADKNGELFRLTHVVKKEKLVKTEI